VQALSNTAIAAAALLVSLVEAAESCTIVSWEDNWFESAAETAETLFIGK